MCGIGGVVSLDKRKPFSKRTQKYAIDLLEKLEDRGTDAWGVFIKHANEHNHYNCWQRDDTITGELFKINGSFTKFKKDKNGRIDTDNLIIILAHTRAETVGNSEDIKNNHPFSTKDFILAHNGAVTNHKELRKKFNIETDVETDSAIIVELIQKFYDESHDVVKAIKETTNLITGGYACWLYHKETDDLYLFRHNNPISYSILPKRNIFVFASEGIMIRDAFDLDYRDYDILDSEKIFKLEGNELKELASIDDEQETHVNVYKPNYPIYTSRLNQSMNTVLEDIYGLIEKIDGRGNLRINRVSDKIVILTASERLKDISAKFAVIAYERDKYGSYFRITIPINKVDDFIDELTAKITNELKDNSNDDFDRKMKMIGDELGFSYTLLGDNKYLLKQEEGFDIYTREIFRKVGLHFSKGGILTVTKGSHADKGIHDIIEKYLGKLEAS